MSINIVGSCGDSDDDKVVTKSSRNKKKKREFSDSDDGIETKTTTPENYIETKTLRSSERLRQKSHKTYTLPKREEVLDNICVKNVKYENRILRPRRLANDFTTSLNRYATDKIGIFESDGSEMSDFIDDSEIAVHKKSCSKRNTLGVKKKTSECEDDNEQKRFGRQRCKKKNRLSSDEEEQMQLKNNVYNKLKHKRHKSSSRHVLSDSDEGKSSSSEDEDSKHIKLPKKITRLISNKKDSQNSDEWQNRNILKRKKSAKKEKKDLLLAELVAKRNMNKDKHSNKQRDANTSVAQLEMQEDMHLAALYDEMEEIQDDNILNSEEEESDREFLDDSDSSGVLETPEDVDNAVYNSGNNALQVKENKVESFQRICVQPESDESDTETFVETVILDVCNAIKKNNIECVKSVLEKTPNIVDELGLKRRTLLHHAVISNSVEITKLLLSANADTLAQDSYLLPPIAYALLAGHIDCLKPLMECTNVRKFNKMCKESFNFNMLHFVFYGKTRFPNLESELAADSTTLKESIRILFEYDECLCQKSISEKDPQGFTPLVAAIVTGNTECVKYMINNSTLMDDFQTTKGGNLLHFAIECSEKMEQVERTLCLDVLLQTSLKHKIDCCDNSGLTPLMYASQNGDHECVLALLKAGASVFCKDKQGTTSLHLAAASGDTQSVKLLLEYGHQVDCLDSWGWPPLLYANFAAQESCVISLMEPDPKQIFVLGDLLNRGKSEAARERNFKVVKDVLIALANQDAYYRVFNEFIRRNPNFLDQYDRGLLHKTWRALLDYDNKLRWFKFKLVRKRTGFRDAIPLQVDREAVFESAMKKLGHFNGARFRDGLDITFKNEAGTCTGPKREFFVNICKDIVDERHKLFHLTDDNQYSFLPNSYFANMTKDPREVKVEDHKIEHTRLSTLSMESSRGFTESSKAQELRNASSHDSVVLVDERDDGSIVTPVGISASASIGVSTVCMDEIGDKIIAELDENDAIYNSMDEIEDRIVAELDIKDIEFCVKDNPEIFKNSTMTAEKQKMSNNLKLTKNLSQLTFLGKIIGAAICEGFFINLHLCKPLVKQILGVELNHPDDLSSFDYELHKNLVTFVLESDDVEGLELPCTLEVVNPWDERLTTLTLFPHQRNEELLNDQNKAEYVNLVSRHKLTVLIKKELDALCQGLFEVIPKSLFSLFTADEFSLLINGVGKIDVEDWRKNTQYTPSDAAITEKEIKWFWEVVNDLKENEKALLLKFSTGSPCVPAGGFSQLQGLGGATMFHISMKPSEWNKIPTASTCFNQLQLPRYHGIKDLKDKLLIAIRHGTEGFSFS